MKHSNRITTAKNPGQSVRIYAPYEEMPKKEELAVLHKSIISNGERNDYAERVEYLINNSVSGGSLSNLFGRFLVGKGDLEKNELNINPRQKFWELLEEIKNDYQKHRGFTILVKYNALCEPVAYYHKPFTDVRKMRRDSDNNEVRYKVSNDWLSDTFVRLVEDNQEYTYYAFNPNKEVIKAQIIECGGVEKYKGQIYYYNGDSSKFHYPHSFVHPVLNDLNTEFLTQLMRNKRVRGGGMSKKIFIIPPTMPEDLNVPDDQLTPEDLNRKRQCENQGQSLRNNIHTFFGAENNEGSLVLEMEFGGDDIDKIMKVIDVKFDSEDGMFEQNENRIADNIRACYFNPPPILIKSDDSFFGTSGEGIKEAKTFYDENVAHERKKLSRAISKCFLIFDTDVQLMSLIDKPITTNDTIN